MTYLYSLPIFGPEIIEKESSIFELIDSLLEKNIFRSKSPPVLYGGSVDGNSVKLFKKIEEIDGFLVGGASKSSKKFIDIIRNYYR